MRQSYYRPCVGDYVLEAVEGGRIYIKPQSKGLKITAHPKAEAFLTELLGQPNDAESADTEGYAAWRIAK